MSRTSSRCSLHVSDGHHTVHLEHFAARCDDVGARVVTPVFEMAGQRWLMRVYPGGDSESSKDYVSVFLVRPAEEKGAIRAQFLIDLRNPERKIDSVTQPTREFKEGIDWGYKKIAKRADVISDGTLHDGTLHIHVVARVYGEPYHHMDANQAIASPGGKCSCGKCTCGAAPAPSVITDLRALLRTGDGADVTLRAGESQIPVHGVILSMRSPVFKTMLRTEMREATTRVVDLSVDEGTAHAFLDYLYFDELDVTSPTSPDLCCHLLKLAHQYEVQSLVDRCTAVLESGLDVASAIERLMLADELGLGKLRAACVKFLTTAQNLEVALESDSWQRLVEMRPRLMADLIQQLGKQTMSGSRKRPRSDESDFKWL